MKKRKEGLNGYINNGHSSDVASEETSVSQPKRRMRNDETDTNAPSSTGSRDKIPATKSFNKMSRGGPDRSTVHHEKPASIEG